MVECLGASNFSNYIFKSNKTRSFYNLRCYAFSFSTVYQPNSSYFLIFSKNSLLKVASICLLRDHHKESSVFLQSSDLAVSLHVLAMSKPETTPLGPSTKEQPHSPTVAHYVLSIFNLRVTWNLVMRLGP